MYSLSMCAKIKVADSVEVATFELPTSQLHKSQCLPTLTPTHAPTPNPESIISKDSARVQINIFSKSKMTYFVMLSLIKQVFFCVCVCHFL